MASAAQIQTEQQRADAECAAKQMLGDLGASYRPNTPLQSVRDFQTAWNVLLPSVKGLAGVLIPSKNSGVLTVDGLYGAQTATAADNFLPSGAQVLPSAASNMPTWFGQNHSAINQMCPPTQPTQPLPPPASITPTPVQTVVAQAQALPSAITSQPDTSSLQPSPPPPPVNPVPVMTTPAPVAVTPQPIQIYSQQSIPVTPPAPPPPALPPEVVKAISTTIPLQTSPVSTTLPSTTITAAKPTGAGPLLLALGIGGVVVAGGLAFLYSRRRAA